MTRPDPVRAENVTSTRGPRRVVHLGTLTVRVGPVHNRTGLAFTKKFLSIALLQCSPRDASCSCVRRTCPIDKRTSLDSRDVILIQESCRHR